ncbi:MAG: hypothetical protein P9L99_14795 [Candidatus Lernaella stagnicola]|nr:hypothetical protein [Candidatus Lernaella stagnicola]
MRKLCFILTLLLATPLLAWAEPGPTPTRCGFSLGLGAGIGIPTEADVADEIPYTWMSELEAKWYLWKPFSLAGGFGFLYAEGEPERMEWHGDWVDLDEPGTSFWRSLWFDGIFRIEIGRNWRFNPYLGGGVGYRYNTLERRGTYRDMQVADYYDEWIPGYLALVGYDFAFDKFIALKMEGRWRIVPTDNTFVDELDQGVWQGLIGVQIYL